jgi:anthranilate synthase component 2
LLKATQAYTRVAFLIGAMYRLLLIDNYDSFTYNLYQMFLELGLDIHVYRNDRITVEEIGRLKPRWIVISPGPGAPKDAGVSKNTIRAFYNKIPVLGVCLGMQAINEVFDGETVLAPVPVHGKKYSIYHRGEAIFAGVPSPFVGARYHSLMARPHSTQLSITARSEDQVIMGMSHVQYPLHGLQFHPESFMTQWGRTLIQNFLSL